MARISILISASALALVTTIAPQAAVAGNICDLTPDPGPLSRGNAIGSNALACGVGSVSFGSYSTGLGTFATALADGGTAVGTGTFVDDTSGTIFGTGFGPAAVPADGDGTATAVGYRAYAVGLNSTAIGDSAGVGVISFPPGQMQFEAVSFGTAIGSGSWVSAFAGTALGAGSTASGENGLAVGWSADASNTGAIALGTNSNASAANSVAIGANSVADQENTISIGAAGAERRIVNVAAGVNATDAVNVGQLQSLTGDVSSIQTSVTNIQTSVSTQATQITALQAADTAFDNRINALETITTNLDERFDDVEDRSDAGTATAVALSGAMYLPGKSFNLTANVGAYRGAIAGAVQFGALVNDRLAVNGGVAHGFNKGSKTALRAGFTLGW